MYKNKFAVIHTYLVCKTWFNLLKMEFDLKLYLKTQFVPLSKHATSRI